MSNNTLHVHIGASHHTSLQLTNPASIVAGIITTIAGDGQPKSAGDGGPATLASVFNPVGAGIDAAGDLYIGDTDACRVRIVSSGGGSSASSSPSRTGTPSSSRTHTPSPSHTPSPTSTPKPPSVGEITTFAGDGIQGNSGNGGPATSAQLHFPMGITPVGSSGAAPAGSVIIADQSNNQLRVVSAAGEGLTICVRTLDYASYECMMDPLHILFALQFDYCAACMTCFLLRHMSHNARRYRRHVIATTCPCLRAQVISPSLRARARRVSMVTVALPRMHC